MDDWTKVFDMTEKSAGFNAQAIIPIYRSSKAALNMIMLHYALKFKEAGWKVNSCCPGFCSTDLNYFMGTERTESGEVNTVRLATLGDDGETGTFSDKAGPIEW